MKRHGPAKPDLILVTLIHQSLRVDAARLAATVAGLRGSDPPSRVPGIQEFFGHYRGQLVLHHRHEDELFFPALAARVGTSTMHLAELASQHEALDTALQAAGESLAVLSDSADVATDGIEAAATLSTMAGLLSAHLSLEERTALPLFESEMPAGDYKKLEAAALKATPRRQAAFLIPWVVAHATPDQRRALLRAAPPLRVALLVSHRHFRHLDQALVPAADLSTSPRQGEAG
ncbi:MAG TPA: hemerythrin domain-containing protein [Streptosporangiaceae bacterium]|nr:hemerythrin domain-containing protein [Streptosporangiaceae bacterium]